MCEDPYCGLVSGDEANSSVQKYIAYYVNCYAESQY